MINESSSRLKSRARGTLLGHYSLPIGAFVLVSLATTAIETVISFLIPHNSSGAALSYIAMLIVAVFSTLFQTGYSYLLLNMARGRQYQLRDLIFPIQTMPDHVILLALRLFLLALACMVPFLAGVILLMLMPGILLMRVVCVLLLLVSLILALVVSLDYSQVFLLYLDNPYLSCKEIMHQSKTLMRGNRIRYFYLLLSFIGISLLGVLSFGIGFFWLVPYMTMTEVEFYRDLIHEHEPFENTTYHFAGSNPF